QRKISPEVTPVSRTNLVLVALLAVVVGLGLAKGVSQEIEKAAVKNRPPDPGFLPGPTLAAMIGGSINSTMFRHWYIVDEQGKTVDAVGGGDSSCAFYVSVLLQSVGLCDGVYPHMDRLVEGMERCGWRELKNEEGDADLMVVIWGTEYGNRHLGFAFKGSTMAVSHSSFEGVPRRHSRTLRDGRTIARRFSHPQLVDLDDSLKLHGVI
ncbi:MAG: hypothetical protein NT039_03675, partial [Candidatus Berkelbacteria bacterium]|nr:hypothetical protein [Candidatus Berkelbacteria bacterium]